MDRWVLYQGVFGCWGWEHFTEQGEVLGESIHVFDDFGECVDDAKGHGFDPHKSFSQARPACGLAVIPLHGSSSASPVSTRPAVTEAGESSLLVPFDIPERNGSIRV